jgi:hypothetical protein
MIAIKKKRCRQVDIVTAYLHAVMRERKVYMRPPPGFAVKQNGKVLVWLLLKALYGLHQAGNLWWEAISNKLVKLGFKPLPDEPCIFVRGTTYIVVYVDDLVITNDDDAGINNVVTEINSSFKVKEIGQPSRFLGCAISRDLDKNTVTISQQAYTKDLLKSFDMQTCSGVDSPMNSGYRTYRNKLEKKEGYPKEEGDPNSQEAPNSTYATLVSSLGWLVTKTRPDLAYSVFRLQRYMQKPVEYDLKAAKRILQYLQHYRLDLVLGQDPSQNLHVYTNAAYQDHADGKSTKGFIIYYAGSPIAWSSKKQTFVTNSTLTAELVAFDKAMKEALYVKKLAVSMGLQVNEAIPVHTNSNNAVELLRRPNYASPSSVRWIESRYFFVKDVLQKKQIEFHHVNSSENPADGFTKPFDKAEHDNYVAKLNMARN